MKKILIAIIILIGLGSFISSLILFSKKIAINPEESMAALSYTRFFQKLKKLPEEPEITIYAVGDIMLDRGVEYKVKKEGKGDFKFPFLKIARELNKADILFGNLEGPISNRGKKVGSIYSFRMDPKAVEGLKYAGFDILSLANNHMLDYQRVALEDTMKILSHAEIGYVGAGPNEIEAFSLKIKDVRDIKVGFLAYTNLGTKSWKATGKRPGLAWITGKDIKRIQEDVRNAKKKVDILIVSLHSGQEYTSEPTAFQKNFDKACINAGADIILGQHPHVVQRIEKYKNGWIAYSLGNFVFDQSFSQETMNGLLLEIIIRSGKIEDVIPKKIRLSKFFQPYFLEE